MSVEPTLGCVVATCRAPWPADDREAQRQWRPDSWFRSYGMCPACLAKQEQVLVNQLTASVIHTLLTIECGSLIADEWQRTRGMDIALRGHKIR